MKMIFVFSLILFSLNLSAQIKPSNHEPVYIRTDTIIIFNSPEIMPHFPGGDIEMMTYIRENLKYPDLDQSTFAENSTVVVRFVVRETGEIDNIIIRRPLTKSFETEVIRLIKNMPKWIPAKTKDKNIACYYTLPIQIHFQTK